MCWLDGWWWEVEDEEEEEEEMEKDEEVMEEEDEEEMEEEMKWLYDLLAIWPSDWTDLGVGLRNEACMSYVWKKNTITATILQCAP